MSLRRKKKCYVKYSWKREIGDMTSTQWVKHLWHLLWWQEIKVSLRENDAGGGGTV